MILDSYYNAYGVVCDSGDKDSICRGAMWPQFSVPELAIECWNRRVQT